MPDPWERWSALSTEERERALRAWGLCAPSDPSRRPLRHPVEASRMAWRRSRLGRAVAREMRRA